MGGAEQPQIPAGRVAASPLITVSEDDSVLRAVRLMHEYQTAHLLVLSPDGPSGVISTFDVAGAMASGVERALGSPPGDTGGSS